MAKDAIKQAGQVVIVEGYVDAVIAHQYGSRQTVACIGSAITEKHIQQLKKLTKQVTLALDPDAAGSAATEHGIQEALKAFDRTIVAVPMASETRKREGRGQRSEPSGMIRLEEQVDAEINIVQLPEGEDPDEVIRRDFSAWLYAITHPLPLIDYYFVVKTAQLDLREAHGKTEASRRLLPVIATISDRVKRDIYLRKLATMISIDERILYEELRLVGRGQKATGVTLRLSQTGSVEGKQEVGGAFGQESNVGGKRSGLDKEGTDRLKWEDYLIGLLLLNPVVSRDVCVIINDGDFIGTDTRELYRILNSMYQRGSSPSYQPIEQQVPSALLETVARARACVESWLPQDEAGLVKSAIQCARRLKRVRLLQLNIELKYLEQDARQAGETMQVRQLWKQMVDIQRQIRQLDASMALHG